MWHRCNNGVAIRTTSDKYDKIPTAACLTRYAVLTVVVDGGVQTVVEDGEGEAAAVVRGIRDGRFSPVLAPRINLMRLRHRVFLLTLASAKAPTTSLDT